MTAWADLGRRGTLEQALGRAHAARNMAREGARIVISFTEITDGGRLLGWHDASGGARRETGGPPWKLAPGALLGRIALAHGSVLMATPKDKILNRNVRPLLAALRKRGVMAMYGGRDFVSADGEIVALLGWARGEAGEVVIDVAIGEVLDPDAPPELDRAHLGKRGRAIEVAGLDAVIAAAYAPDGTPRVLEPIDPPVRPAAPPASASTAVAIGRLSAHPMAERIALRGDFFADDALASLEVALASLPSEQLLAHVTASDVTVEGIAEWPRTVAELIRAARTP